MDVLLTVGTVAGIIGLPGLISAVAALRLSRLSRGFELGTAARREESILIMRGLLAVGSLSEATAIAVKESEQMKANGKMTSALSHYRGYSRALGDYLLRQNAEKNHK